jgi:hypothetical protein
MNRFFTLLLAASCLTAVGQVTYPYNPDGNADGDIAVGDLQDFLVTYGNPFSPSEIMVGDSSLTYWVDQLSILLQNQQHLIDSLSAATGRMTLGQAENFSFHMLEWSQTENGGYRTILNFENDGFARITGGNAQIKFVVIPDSTSLELIADDDAAETNFSETFWEGVPALTIPLSSSETLVLFGGSGALEEETTAGEMQLNWSPILQQETVQFNSMDTLIQPDGEHNFDLFGNYSRIDIGVPPIDRFDVYWYDNYFGYQQNSNVSVSEVVDFVASTPNVIWVYPRYDPINIQIQGVTSEKMCIAVDQIFPSEQEWSLIANVLAQAATFTNTTVSIPSFHFPDNNEASYPSIRIFNGDMEITSFQWPHTLWDENTFTSNEILNPNHDTRAVVNLITLRSSGQWVVVGDWDY